MRNCKIAFLVFSFALVCGGWGKTFRSKFITLDLPPNWDCQEEELDWVCQPENPNLRNEALVVVVTKEAKPSDDNMQKYEEYLKSPKQMRDLVGNTYMTDIKYTKKKLIRNWWWMDSLQMGSEVPGFVSRYVVSIKEQIAAMISYHVAESVFPKWADTLDKMIESTELRFDPKAFDEIMRNRNSNILANKGGLLGRRSPGSVQENAKTPTGTSSELIQTISIVALIVAAIGYIIYRKRKGMS